MQTITTKNLEINQVSIHTNVQVMSGILKSMQLQHQ